MRKIMIHLFLFIFVCQSALAFPLKPGFTGTYSDSSRIAAAWEKIESGECGHALSAHALSPERTELLLERMVTEEISMGEIVELFEGAVQTRCGLSADARTAFDALLMETKIRRIDFKALTRGEVELVVEATMPREFEALLVETDHEPSPRGVSEKVEPITIGCVVAFIAGVGKIGACMNDVYGQQDDCNAGWVCTPHGPTDQSCCDSKAGRDLTNCLASVGLNGPDRDYHLCCI